MLKTFMKSTLLIAVALATLFSGPLTQTADAQTTPDDREQVIALLTTALQRLQSEQSGDAEQGRAAYAAAVRYLQEQNETYYAPYRLQLQRYQDLAQDRGRWSMVRDFLVDEYQVSPYWIGVQCEPVEEFSMLVNGDALVTVKGGLVVTSITEDSPAESSGLKTDDIIFYFNDQQTNSLAQLVAAISTAGQTESTLSVVRNEKLISVQLTPAIREQDAYVSSAEYAGDLLVNEARAVALPEGYEYQMRLRLIDEDGETWEVGVEEVDELPEHAQEFARLVLESSARSGPHSNAYLQWHDVAFPDEARPAVYQWLQATGEKQTGKLDEIEKKLDELRLMVEKLKDER